MYFAPGATHAPHQVPPEWIEKYKGKFAHGWDRQREITFDRQKDLGVVPPTAVLTPRHAEIPAWEDIDPALKPVLEREMEVYAAFLSTPITTWVCLLDALGPVLDDMLVYLIIGDNGASAEGTLQGAFNEMANFNGLPELRRPSSCCPSSTSSVAKGPTATTPSGGPGRWTRRISGLSRWPRTGAALETAPSCTGRMGSRPRAVCADQFSHVIDFAPTVLQAAGIPEPTLVNGVMQSPYEGTSMLYSFDDGQAPERHETQYFEMFCNRGIYHKGWSAVTKHRTAWEMGGQAMPAFDDDVWELYDGSTDWTQANDLSKDNPQKLHELQRLWLIEAVKYNVLPLDDRQIERANAETAGRPTLIKGNTQLLFGGMGRLSENSVLNIKNKSFAVTAELDVPADGGAGVIIAQGGRFGGWSLYAKDGHAKFYYNVLGIKSYDIVGTEQIPTGKTQVRMEFTYDGGGMGREAASRSTATARRSAQAESTRLRASSSPPTRPPTSAMNPAPQSVPTTPPTPADSTARFTGCRSISARTPRMRTTTSTPTRDSGSRWRGSNQFGRRRSVSEKTTYAAARIGRMTETKVRRLTIEARRPGRRRPAIVRSANALLLARHARRIPLGP